MWVSADWSFFGCTGENGCFIYLFDFMRTYLRGIRSTSSFEGSPLGKMTEATAELGTVLTVILMAFELDSSTKHCSLAAMACSVGFWSLLAK